MYLVDDDIFNTNRVNDNNTKHPKDSEYGIPKNNVAGLHIKTNDVIRAYRIQSFDDNWWYDNTSTILLLSTS